MPVAEALAGAQQTAHVLRSARYAGTARRRGGRLVRQIPPDGIRRDYAAALLVLVGALRPAWDALLAELRAAIGTRTDAERTDAGDGARARRAVAKARRQMAGAITTSQIEKLARKFAAQTATHQRIQMGRQVRQALGVDVTASDAGIAPVIDNFAHANASLITSIPQQLADKAESLTLNAIQNGRRWEDVADDLESQYGIAETRAKIIARDQVGKLVADVDQARQQSLGIRRFIWRCMNDELVRGRPDGKYPKAKTSHWDLRNKTFSYDDPPLNDDGEPILPGDEPLCRCYAEPVFDDVLGVAEGDESGYEDDAGGDSDED